MINLEKMGIENLVTNKTINKMSLQNYVKAYIIRRLEICFKYIGKML